jgi:cytosine/adenosine deaminase-related metal-dependent hydrolase
MSTNSVVLKNGLIVTVNDRSEVFSGDILIEGKNIKKIEKNIKTDAAEYFDAGNYIIIPGFVQTHVHLCQTLFRNFADDLTLLDWLNQKIYPLEAMHTPESLKISAQLGIAELMLGGTSTILDMGTVYHMDVVFEELVRSGIRAYCGKTMMDYGDIPSAMLENTRESIDTSLALMDRWHDKEDGRIKYAFAPRFILSCSKELLIETAKLTAKYNLPFHTHASQNISEVNLVNDIYQQDTITFFDEIGATGPNLCLAHCVWLNNKEKEILRDNNIKVLHCPSSNLKLGSGIAPIPEYLDQGITVSMGADGAPCNNNLDAFTEMRLAALIQKPKYGPKSMDSETVFRMATIEGAKTLGLEKEIGSIEVGKKADLALVKLNQIQSIPFKSVYSKLVYSTPSSAVEHLMIDGKWVLRNRSLINYNIDDLMQEVNKISKPN